MFEAIVCNEEYGGHLNSRKELPISDPYVTAVLEFHKWNHSGTISADDFNSVFRAIRCGFIEKSEANRGNLYTNFSQKIPNRNLLRELIAK